MLEKAIEFASDHSVVITATVVTIYHKWEKIRGLEGLWNFIRTGSVNPQPKP